MSELPDLKVCPECGGEAFFSTVPFDNSIACIRCSECLCWFSKSDDEAQKDLAKRWNDEDRSAIFRCPHCRECGYYSNHLPLLDCYRCDQPFTPVLSEGEDFLPCEQEEE